MKNLESRRSKNVESKRKSLESSDIDFIKEIDELRLLRPRTTTNTIQDESQAISSADLEEIRELFESAREARELEESDLETKEFLGKLEGYLPSQPQSTTDTKSTDLEELLNASDRKDNKTQGETSLGEFSALMSTLSSATGKVGDVISDLSSDELAAYKAIIKDAQSTIIDEQEKRLERERRAGIDRILDGQ